MSTGDYHKLHTAKYILLSYINLRVDPVSFVFKNFRFKTTLNYIPWRG